jgi:hypothetical protein
VFFLALSNEVSFASVYNWNRGEKCSEGVDSCQENDENWLELAGAGAWR